MYHPHVCDLLQYNRRPILTANEEIHEKIRGQSVRQVEVLADSDTAVIRYVDELW